MNKPIKEMRGLLNAVKQLNESNRFLDPEDEIMFGENTPVVYAYEEDPATRNLDIRGVPVSLDEWEIVMSAAVPDGYNNFEAEKVAHVFAGIPEVERVQFVPGREGSVVVYVTTNGDTALAKVVAQYLGSMKKKLRADELWMARGSDDTIRIWWD